MTWKPPGACFSGHRPETLFFTQDSHHKFIVLKGFGDNLKVRSGPQAREEPHPGTFPVFGNGFS
jgi:hypothetical protein